MSEITVSTKQPLKELSATMVWKHWNDWHMRVNQRMSDLHCSDEMFADFSTVSLFVPEQTLRDMCGFDVDSPIPGGWSYDRFVAWLIAAKADYRNIAFPRL